MLWSASWIEEKTEITFIFVLFLFVPNMTVTEKQMFLQMTFQQKVTVSRAVHLILCTSSCLDYLLEMKLILSSLETFTKLCSEPEFVNLPVKSLKMTFIALNL